MDQKTLGNRIRKVRLQKKLTLEKIAQSTGFTKSYLSLIELGKKSPPIATLTRIALALEVDIVAFFHEKSLKDRITIVREDEREVVVKDPSSIGYTYEAIAFTRKQKRMEAFVITHLLPQESPFTDHEGEELMYILEGKLNFFYGEEVFLLKAGDAVYFDSGVPHRGESIGRKQAKVLAVITQPGYSFD